MELNTNGKSFSKEDIYSTIELHDKTTGIYQNISEVENRNQNTANNKNNSMKTDITNRNLRCWVFALSCIVITTNVICVGVLYVCFMKPSTSASQQGTLSAAQTSMINKKNSMEEDFEKLFKDIEEPVVNNSSQITLMKHEILAMGTNIMNMIEDQNLSLEKNIMKIIDIKLENKTVQNKNGGIDQRPRNCNKCFINWGPTHDVYGDGSLYYTAFRATAGVGSSVLQAYKGQAAKVNLEASCQHANGSCSGHYRNDVILDSWQSIDHVVLAVYTRGQLMASAKFRAFGTSFTSWLGHDKLISTDLWDINSTNHFSIEGNGVQRRFFINGNYGGCEKDAGWLVVQEPGTSGRCGWETPGPYPRFFYSPVASRVTWHKGQPAARQADTLMVYVKPWQGC